MTDNLSMGTEIILRENSATIQELTIAVDRFVFLLKY